MQAETEAVRLAVDALLAHQAKFLEFQTSPEMVTLRNSRAIDVDNETLRKLHEIININTNLINDMNRAVGAWWVAKLQVKNWWQGDKTPDDRIRVRFDGKGRPYALLYRV